MFKRVNGTSVVLQCNLKARKIKRHAVSLIRYTLARPVRAKRLAGPMGSNEIEANALMEKQLVNMRPPACNLVAAAVGFLTITPVSRQAC
ncbi:MAG TPA: hypothetical protein VG897_03550 [Terriglobales bacterium]|nr:hypothetical protein [Terriglobales bacterium]